MALGVVESGFDVLLAVAVVFTIEMWLESWEGHGSFWKSLIKAAPWAPAMYAFVLGMLVFLGGIGLTVRSLYLFLRHGAWSWPSNWEVLRALEVRVVSLTGWVGIDRIANDALTWSAVPTLLLAPFVAMFLGFAVLAFVARILIR